MANVFRPYIKVTGGTSDALDGETQMIEGDTALVSTSGGDFYVYVCRNSSATASSPSVIQPVNVTSGLRWHLSHVTTQGSEKWATSVGGTANAITLAFAPAFTSVPIGVPLYFRAAQANTDSVTISIDGQPAITAKKFGSSNLAGGDLAAGQVICILYDGTNLQAMGIGSPSPVFQTIDTGSNGAISITVPGGPTDPTGCLFIVKANGVPNNSGATTLTYNGVTKNIQRWNSENLRYLDYSGGSMLIIAWDPGISTWRLLNPKNPGPYARVLSRTANGTLYSTDSGSVVELTASAVITMTLQDCVSNVSYQFVNTGSMYATITSTSAFKHAELPDGLTSVNIAPGDTLEVCFISSVWQITKSSELDREYVNYFDNPALTLQTSNVAQITPASGSTAASYFFDRWWCTHQITTVSRPIKWTYESRAVPDVPYALNFIKATPDTPTAMAASEYAYGIYQTMPGRTVAALVNKTVTIAFYAYVGVAGIYCASVINRDETYTYVKKFSLAANTLTLCTMTLPLSSAYVNPNNDYNRGLLFSFGGYAITTSIYATASTNQWVSGNKLCSTDATFWPSDAAATISVGALQFLVGGNPRRFRVPDFEEVKTTCSFYRPYIDGTSLSANAIIAQGYITETNSALFVLPIRTRKNPTGIALTGSASYTIFVVGNSSGVSSTAAQIGLFTTPVSAQISFYRNLQSALTVNSPAFLSISGTSFYLTGAEL